MVPLWKEKFMDITYLVQRQNRRQDKPMLQGVYQKATRDFAI
jgi:hypothetical protein